MGTPLNDAIAPNEPKSMDAGFVAKDTQPQVNPDTQLPLDSAIPIADAQPKQDTSPALAKDAGAARDAALAKDTAVPTDTALAKDAGAARDTALAKDASPAPDALPACVPIPSTQTQPSQQPDGGAAPVSAMSYNINFIGDYLDRTPLDRGTGISTYPMGSDTDVNANPFTDGTGTGTLGPTDTALYRIDGPMFPPFATASITDPSSATVYQAEQAVWVDGYSSYSSQAMSVVSAGVVGAGVIGTLNSFSYTLKLSGASDAFGIPVCTTPTNNTDYSTCTTHYQTANHKVAIPFLGGTWLISGMTPPSTPLTSETLLASGGSVKLAQEEVGGVIANMGSAPTSMTVDNIQFTLFINDTTKGVAIVSALDTETCEFFGYFDLPLGATTYLNLKKGEPAYLLHVWEISPTIFGTAWADISVFSKEITLTSGQPLDQANGTNPDWPAYLGWKNQGASATDTNPDHLRTIILYAGGSDISKLSSGGSSDLNVGDFIPIAQNPQSMTFQYNGLSLTLDSYTLLTFELNPISDFAISSGPNGQACTITAPYVHVISGAPSPAFTINPQGAASPVSGYDFLVATSGATCSGSIGQLMAGALFMELSDNSWAYQDYAPFSSTGGAVVNYPLAGAAVPGSTFGPGTITYENQDVTANVLPPGTADFVFTVGEDAGASFSVYSQFGLRLGQSPSFNYTATAPNGDYWFKQDTIVSCGAGPVTTPNASSGCLLPSSGGMFRPSGFVNDRGSTFVGMTNSVVQFNIASQIAYAQFVLNLIRY